MPFQLIDRLSILNRVIERSEIGWKILLYNFAPEKCIKRWVFLNIVKLMKTP